MTHVPAVPKEPVSCADEGAGTLGDVANAERRDPEIGAWSGESGDANVNLGSQSWFGDLKQNLTNRWTVRESATIAPD